MADARCEINDPYSLPGVLAQWGKNEMKLSSTLQVETKGLASCLAPACKGSAMVALWKQVTNQVKSRSWAEHVRKNIKLSELSLESERLMSSLEERSRALEDVEKDIESLQLQLKRHKEELQESKSELMNSEQGNRLLEMKSCMYQNHGKYSQTKNEGVRSFSQWISEICVAYEQRPGETNSEKLDLECEKDVENVCCLDGEKSPSSQTYESIRELVKYYHPRLIVSSLVKLCEKSTATLKVDEERAEFLSDLKKLESHYLDEEKSGQSEGTKLATVQTMLSQWDLDFVNGFTQSQICKMNAENILFEIEQERNQFASRLEAQYEFEPSNMQLTIDLLDAEIELATVRGSIKSFQSSVARLEQDVHLKTQARDHLFAVKAKIDGLSDTLSKNQDRIIEITKHNGAIKSKLNERQAQILSIAQKEICNKKLEVAKMCSDIRSCLAERLTAFSHVSLSKLWRVDIDPAIVPQVQCLSIYKYLDVSPANGKMFQQKIAKGLNIHRHAAVSAILQRAVDIKKEISRDKLLRDAFVDTTLSDKKLQTVCELAEEGAKVEKQQVETITSKYKNGLAILESALKQCQALDQTIVTWYEQPAQYQTPWLTAEGRSLQEWKSKIENPLPQTT